MEMERVLQLDDPAVLPDGATYEDSVFTLTAAGDYIVAGTLEGRLIVDADGPVTLVCDGVTLIGQDCLTVRSGDPVTVIGTAGTENVFTDLPVDPASGEIRSVEPAAAASTESSGEASGSAEAADEVSPAQRLPDTQSSAASAEDAGSGAEEPKEETDASGAVITSKAPLLFAVGSITVNADINNGIRAKDGLTVQNGSLTVNAANDAVKAKGGISVLGGSLNVTAGGDALQTEAGRVTGGSVDLRGGSVTLTAGDRGIDAESIVLFAGGTVTVVSENDAVRADTISVTGGEIVLDSQGDGLQAVTDLTVSGGNLSIVTGGGGGSAINHPGESFGGPWGQTSSAAEDEASTKGLKSDGSITVSGGVVDLSTNDDSIHCGTLFTMDGGTVTICANDDAIHADDWLVINDGTVRIDDCFEGLEAFAVEVRGGDVVIRAVNDGINANGQEMMFRRSSSEESGVTSLSGSATTYFRMAGGKVDLVVTGNTSNQGDGVDSNGAVYITGGELIVSTFGSFMENGLDTGSGGPIVTGGKVIAGGASSMSEPFGSSSTQCAATVKASYMPDGTEVVLSDAEGNILWDVVLADGFSCLQISHPDMQVGQVYTLTFGSQTKTLDFTNSNLVEIGGGGGGFRPF